jgi:uncharacterized protein
MPIELRIDDPEIENKYRTADEILNLLKSLVRNELILIPSAKKEVLSKDKIIKLISEYFKDKPVIRAYLFGSYSREEATSESDLDILIELDSTKKVGSLFFKMKAELEELMNKEVDLLTTNSINPKIKENIMNERILIYERKDK